MTQPSTFVSPRRAEMLAYDGAVLDVVRKLGEACVGDVLDAIGTRWRNATKIDFALRRLEHAGTLVGELRPGRGHSGLRYYRLAGAPPSAASAEANARVVELEAERQRLEREILDLLRGSKHELYSTEIAVALGKRGNEGQKVVKTRLTTMVRRGVLLARKVEAGALGTEARPRTYYRIAGEGCP
jgi:hypothetical protein